MLIPGSVAVPVALTAQLNAGDWLFSVQADPALMHILQHQLDCMKMCN